LRGGCKADRSRCLRGIVYQSDIDSGRAPMTLNVNCPHCGEMHAVSVRETYIDDAIRNVSEIARRV
jgi:hypothetical protein